MARDIGVQYQVELYQTLKMVFSVTLLNIQHYNLWIKDKLEQSRENSRAYPSTMVE